MGRSSHTQCDLLDSFKMLQSKALRVQVSRSIKAKTQDNQQVWTYVDGRYSFEFATCFFEKWWLCHKSLIDSCARQCCDGKSWLLNWLSRLFLTLVFGIKFLFGLLDLRLFNLRAEFSGHYRQVLFADEVHSLWKNWSLRFNGDSTRTTHRSLHLVCALISAFASVNHFLFISCLLMNSWC